MSKQAQVGIFALVALFLLFGVFFTITDFATRHSGYRVGVHFNSAAGLHSGALVYFSGVTAGSVDSLDLLPDHTVDVILAVNKDIDIPRDSRFLIQAPLTGDPSLIIVPPAPKPRPPGIVGPTPAPTAGPLLERAVLPIDEQPQGRDSATIGDLLEQGQGEVKRLDTMLGQLESREPALLGTLQSTLNNANELTTSANQQMRSLFGQSHQIADTMQSAVGRAAGNIVDLTDTLNSTVASNSGKIDTLLTTLNATAVSLNQSVGALKGLATNPNLKQNLLDTTQNIAQTTQTVAALTSDLRQITGNPQTQAQLRDTIAELDAATQKANSLLAALGGTSRVYGVDAGASPAPNGGKVGPPNAEPPAPGGVPPNFKQKLAGVAKSLVAIQVRINELSPQRTIGTNTLLGSDRGPQADFNLLLLPKADTSLFVGANDVGAKTSYNFALLQNAGSGFRIGGGVLYSQLGVLGSYNRDRIGLEGRLYNLRRPTLDAYLNARVTPLSQLFIGERDLTRGERRTVFGLQLQF